MRHASDGDKLKNRSPKVTTRREFIGSIPAVGAAFAIGGSVAL
jgi:hypothetical protein